MTGVPEIGDVCALLGHRRPVDSDTNFFEAGFSSAELAEALAGLREAGLPITLIDMYRFPTVRALVTEARRRAEPDRPAGATGLPWLSRDRP